MNAVQEFLAENPFQKSVAQILVKAGSKMAAVVTIRNAMLHAAVMAGTATVACDAPGFTLVDAAAEVRAMEEAMMAKA